MCSQTGLSSLSHFPRTPFVSLTLVSNLFTHSACIAFFFAPALSLILSLPLILCLYLSHFTSCSVTASFAPYHNLHLFIKLSLSNHLLLPFLLLSLSCLIFRRETGCSHGIVNICPKTQTQSTQSAAVATTTAAAAAAAAGVACVWVLLFLCQSCYSGQQTDSVME